MKKIRITIPHSNDVEDIKHISNYECIKELGKASLPFKVEYNVCKGALIGHARNDMILRKAFFTEGDKIEGFDYNLQLDTDVFFTPDDLIKIYEAAEENNYQVISGAYPQRGRDDLVNAGMWDEYTGDNSIELSFKMTDTGIKKADWCAAGFLLNHISVFTETEYPWFYPPVIKHENCTYCPGEDIGFSIKCHENNIQMYCDCDCKLKHLI